MKDSSFYFGWQVNAFTHNHHVIISENFLLFLSLLCGCLVLQHYVEKEYKITFLPGALATMLVSVIVGGIIRLSIPHDESFSPLVIGFSSDVLYFGLLPPIIFDSAYHLRRRLFFGNLGAVFALACAGTIIITMLTALGISMIQHYGAKFGIDVTFTVMERITFACALSATDPVSTLAVFSNLKVDPTLFYAMLGESVLNDAVAVTAFRVSSRLIEATSLTYLDGIACAVNFIVLAIGSSVIGYGTGLMVALGLKHTHFGKDKVVPMGIVVCAMYIPFFLAEILQLSGVVAIFFGGIAARRYVHKNLTLEVRKFAAFIFHLLAHCAETTCFVLLGLSVFLVDFPFSQLPFMLLVLVVCLIARPMAVYPLLSMLNLYRRKHTLHPVAPADAPIARESAKRSPGYDSVPTVEENLESGTSVNINVADATEKVTRDSSQVDGAYMKGQTHQAPSSLHVHFVSSLPHAAPAAMHTDPINPLSGLRHSLSSESSLTGYEAAADIKNIKLPLAKPISLANMHVIAFAGMRGAVSFSLAYIFPDSRGNRDLVLCTAIVIVLFTSFFNGTLTEPLIRWLNITTNVDMSDYLKKHEAPDDVLEFERLVLYPLILKTRAEPYHKKKLHEKASFSPLCGPCNAIENEPANAVPDENNVVSQNHRAVPGLALTSSSLQRASVGLHNFFHDRGFHHMRAGKHERAMSDAVSSGGGSLISADDHRHILHNTHSPENSPGGLNYRRSFSPHAQPNIHAPRHAHFPVHRRATSEGQKNSSFSSSPPILSNLRNPFSLAPAILSKSARKAPPPLRVVPQPLPTQLPLSLIDELKLVISRRASEVESVSPAPYSGIAGPGASVFNHLTARNGYYTPLLRALSPAESAAEAEVARYSPGPAPITPPACNEKEFSQSRAPTWRTVSQVQLSSALGGATSAVSLRGTSAGLLGDALSAQHDHSPSQCTASVEEVATVSADATPSTEGGSEETEGVFRTVEDKV